MGLTSRRTRSGQESSAGCRSDLEVMSDYFFSLGDAGNSKRTSGRRRRRGGRGSTPAQLTCRCQSTTGPTGRKQQKQSLSSVPG